MLMVSSPTDRPLRCSPRRHSRNAGDWQQIQQHRQHGPSHQQRTSLSIEVSQKREPTVLDRELSAPNVLKILQEPRIRQRDPLP